MENFDPKKINLESLIWLLIVSSFPQGAKEDKKDYKRELCDLINKNQNIFNIDVRVTDLDEHIQKEVGKAIFYSLDFETAVNSGCAKIGHEKDGFPYFIQWNRQLNLEQLYRIIKLINIYGIDSIRLPEISRCILCLISPDYANRFTEPTDDKV